MCTKKTLYSVGTKDKVNLSSRHRGGALKNFAQVSYSTDCVREIANALDISMADAIGRIRAVDGAFENIYREARKPEQRPAKVVAREVMSL
ncbi:MAG: hypothetical protein K6E86_01840 [Bacteroidales bacterium]|nr:hypothetical protein [Bacteroidales bacterium]